MILWLLHFQCILLILSCLTAFDRTSSTISNRYEGFVEPCCDPDFTEISLSSSPFNLIYLLACCKLSLIWLVMSLAFPISPRPLSRRCVGFCQRPLQHLMRWLCGSFFFHPFLYGRLYWLIFLYVEPFLHLRDEAYLIMWKIFLMCPWI